ncbi:MAG: maltotransferase domain-containing protein, partial [Pirellulales bacterium]
MQFDGRSRVVINALKPEIDCGRYPIKRAIGEHVVVETAAFTDGHDRVRSVLRYRREDAGNWLESPMEPLGQDRWRGQFTVSELGRYRYTVQAWVDRFHTWRHDLEKRHQAGSVQAVDLWVGAELVRQAASRASRSDAARLHEMADVLSGDHGLAVRVETALDPGLLELMDRYPDRSLASNYARELSVVVDRPKARFSAWYELFPRSMAPEPGVHGTLADCARRLPYVASMGFDVLYLPPIHPIGTSYRKGRNNAPQAEPGDTGSPWAIGSAEGGHKSVHP